MSKKDDRAVCRAAWEMLLEHGMARRKLPCYSHTLSDDHAEGWAAVWPADAIPMLAADDSPLNTSIAVVETREGGDAKEGRYRLVIVGRNPAKAKLIEGYILAYHPYLKTYRRNPACATSAGKSPMKTECRQLAGR